MSRNLDRHGIGDDLAGLPVVLHPRGMRESDPYRPVLDHELHIDRVSMPRRDGDNESLILAMQLLARPLVDGVKVVVHNPQTIADRPKSGNDEAHKPRTWRPGTLLPSRLLAHFAQDHLHVHLALATVDGDGD